MRLILGFEKKKEEITREVKVLKDKKMTMKTKYVELECKFPLLLPTASSLHSGLQMQPTCSLQKKEPLISVIMTHYNCVKYVGNSIVSILTQSWLNLELWLIDDGSDESVKEELVPLCEHFSRDSRFRYVLLERNVGCYSAKNVGICMARGEWITFQDADDYSLRDRLEKQYDMCLRYKLFACYAGYTCRISGRLKSAEITFFANLAVFRKTFGFFDTVRIAGDSELRHRLNLSKERYVDMREYLYVCLDKWMEDGYRRDVSLTQNVSTPIGGRLRKIYKSVYSMDRDASSNVPSSSSLLYSFVNKTHHDYIRLNYDIENIASLFPDFDALVDIFRCVGVSHNFKRGGERNLGK